MQKIRSGRRPTIFVWQMGCIVFSNLHKINVSSKQSKQNKYDYSYKQKLSKSKYKGLLPSNFFCCNNCNITTLLQGFIKGGAYAGQREWYLVHNGWYVATQTIYIHILFKIFLYLSFYN